MKPKSEYLWNGWSLISGQAADVLSNTLCEYPLNMFRCPSILLYSYLVFTHIHIVLMLLSVICCRFVTVKKQLCMNPENEWVERAMNYIDKKKASNSTKWNLEEMIQTHTDTHTHTSKLNKCVILCYCNEYYLNVLISWSMSIIYALLVWCNILVIILLISI